ncbi:MAG: discoidin domain-containing protein [Phycisphaerae bacterium]|nr:discoidin domain-containing protein [Phycisphaerae bacterium]
MNRGLVHLISVVLLLAGAGPLVWGQDNQVQNPEFDNGLVSWGLYGASGFTVSVVSGARLSGPNAALIDVTDPSVTSIGIAQGNLKFERGKKYPIGVTAKADKEREMVILIQLYKPEGPSWIDIVLQRVSLTTEPQTFLFEYTHNDDSMTDHPAWVATMYLMLKGQWWPMAGDTVASKVWVDRVHVGQQPPLADSRIRSASAPEPANNAGDVSCDTGLKWTPGEFAGTHDVYFGKTFADVNAASRDNPRGVQVSQGQTDAQYVPDGLLAYGQTYYWRIDEVNKTPDNTIFKGNVWSFTAEPYSYPLTGVKATASNSQPNMGPEKTVDGSGLAGDLHGTESTTMWMSIGAQPTWIQYEFDAMYKLDKLLVWNSNQIIETFIGFGAKDVMIEYSVDGVQWTKLTGVPQFAQGTGMAAYAANTTVGFGGVMAKYVRLTIDKNYSAVATQTGLAEVRFFYVPVQARAPLPAAGATGISINGDLQWRPGREATSHQVYFGTDSNAVAAGAVAAQTVTDHNGAPGPMNLGTTYYWRVDEIGGAGPYAGSVWSFTTQEYAVVDDFEAYNDTDNRIYDSWIDGFDNPKANGAIVGKDQAPFAEQTIIHGGKQSMPLSYDNAGTAVSEAQLALDQNWTASGIKSLSLYFRGAAGNTGQLYVKINNAKVVYDGAAADLAAAQWLPWNIDLSKVATTLSHVTSLTIGIAGAGAKGTLYLDDIRLYPKTLEFIVPVAPGVAGLVAHYTFDGNFKDSAGSHQGTAFGDAKVVSDPVRGQVLAVDGNGDGVDIPYSADLNPPAFTVGLWANPSSAGSDYRSPITSRDDTPQRGYILYVEPGNTWQFWTGTGTGWDNTAGPAAQLDEWVHVTATLASDQKMLYLNGRLVAQSTAPLSPNTQWPLRIGGGATESTAGNYFFRGLIDEVCLYNRALSAEEVAGLAGRTQPLQKPF